MDNISRAVAVDLVCRHYTGCVLPTDCLVYIIKHSYVKFPRQRKRRDRVNLIPEYNERGARIKKIKSKVRIKRALRLKYS